MLINLNFANNLARWFCQLSELRVFGNGKEFFFTCSLHIEPVEKFYNVHAGNKDGFDHLSSLEHGKGSVHSVKGVGVLVDTGFSLHNKFHFP